MDGVNTRSFSRDGVTSCLPTLGQVNVSQHLTNRQRRIAFPNSSTILYTRKCIVSRGLVSHSVTILSPGTNLRRAACNKSAYIIDGTGGSCGITSWADNGAKAYVRQKRNGSGLRPPRSRNRWKTSEQGVNANPIIGIIGNG